MSGVDVGVVRARVDAIRQEFYKTQMGMLKAAHLPDSTPVDNTLGNVRSVVNDKDYLLHASEQLLTELARLTGELAVARGQGWTDPSEVIERLRNKALWMDESEHRADLREAIEECDLQTRYLEAIGENANASDRDADHWQQRAKRLETALQSIANLPGHEAECVCGDGGDTRGPFMQIAPGSESGWLDESEVQRIAHEALAGGQ